MTTSERPVISRRENLRGWLLLFLRSEIDAATLISIEKKAAAELLPLQDNAAKRNGFSCERILHTAFE
jgi:hypothetical protein